MTTIAVQCRCGATIQSRPNKDGSAKMPKRWRKIADAFTCPKCVKEAYYTRAIRLELGAVQTRKDRDPKEFRKVLAAASAASAKFGNWYVQRLFAIDPGTSPTLEKTRDGKTKLPVLPALDVYQEARRLFPDLSPRTITALSQMVRSWYMKRRFASLVLLKRSVESYRFGYLPVEVPKQGWSLRKTEDGKMLLTVSVAPGDSWRVLVYADPMNRTRLQQIEAGEAVALALKVVRGTKRLANGEPRKSWFVRISAMFPRRSYRERDPDRVLTLQNGSRSLLVGEIVGSDDGFEYPGATLQKLIIGGDAADRRWQQENSVQRGLWSRRKRDRWARDRTRMSEARRRKITAQLDLVAAALARWCRSHRVGVVHYDAADHGFVPHLPWAALRDKMHNALEALGIELVITDLAALAAPGCETE